MIRYSLVPEGTKYWDREALVDYTSVYMCYGNFENILNDQLRDRKTPKGIFLSFEFSTYKGYSPTVKRTQLRMFKEIYKPFMDKYYKGKWWFTRKERGVWFSADIPLYVIVQATSFFRLGSNSPENLKKWTKWRKKYPPILSYIGAYSLEGCGDKYGREYSEDYKWLYKSMHMPFSTKITIKQAVALVRNLKGHTKPTEILSMKEVLGKGENPTYDGRDAWMVSGIPFKNLRVSVSDSRKVSKDTVKHCSNGWEVCVSKEWVQELIASCLKEEMKNVRP